MTINERYDSIFEQCRRQIIKYNFINGLPLIKIKESAIEEQVKEIKPISKEEFKKQEHKLIMKTWEELVLAYDEEETKSYTKE